ncbi:unnamed protein product [Urochloa humidicola]
MAKESRRMRKRITSILDVLPDDLIELVLLRLRTPICLARAAATCKPWRRVVAGAGFLRRFHALHRPDDHLLLGHYCVNTETTDNINALPRLNAEFIPSPPRPATAAANHHLRRRLALDFLSRPPPYSYAHQRVLTDSHGGLLAFIQDNWYAVVCDPWTRQFKEVRFPWGQNDGDRDRTYHCIGAFLLDSDDAGNGCCSPMSSSFRVLCVCLVMDYMDDRVEAHACVFSARHDGWVQFSVSTDIGRVHWTGGFSLDRLDTYKRIVGRAGGSIFWFTYHGYLLALDENTREFSTFRLPVAPDVDVYISRARQLYHEQTVRVVGGGAAAAGAVRVVSVVDGDLEVLVLNWAPHGEWECTVERRSS